ncbi:MAG: PBP1A family penicillin-binding protein [Clostridia bacterium]|nr:PBP1A family penicillin-binding protein [Clostridia bacterium]
MADLASFLRKCASRLKTKKRDRLRVNILGGVFKILLSVILVAIITGSICLMAAAVYISRYIDTDMDLSITSTELNYSTQIFAPGAEGSNEVIYTLHGEQNREWVSYENIPDYLKKAIVAIEDERFWTHRGVDWKRTLSAGVHLLSGFSSSYGGSTITQQLIKNITGDDEVTVQRKIQEILRAMELEKNMSKEEILELYLNTISLSQGCYGVQTAAKVYFGKDVSELTLAECASIAGITNLPSYYDPFVYPEHNIARQKDILWKMHELGVITDAEYEAAKNEELVFLRDNEEEEDEPQEVQSYYIDLVIDTVIRDLQNQLGYSKEVATRLLYSGGLQIYTTMDSRVQSVMERVYADSSNFQRLAGITQPQSAMIVYSTDGDILGVVGGRGTKQGARVLNRAKSLRSAGSAIKPLSAYSPALENDLITPFTVVDDFPDLYTNEAGTLIEKPEEYRGKLKAYPKNYYSGFRGLVTVRRAVELSINTVAVKMVEELGIPKSYSFLESRFGISTLVNTSEKGDMNYGSLALGGFYRGISLLELTSGYTTFTNDGVHNHPRCYTIITDADGNVLIDNVHRSSKVLSEKANYYMTYMLESAVTRGTSTAAKISGIATAGKTGTTNADKDRWFIGYTPYYVGGVWYGYDYPKEIKGADGNPALKAWKLVMDELHEGLPQAEFVVPDMLVSASYCMDSGGKPTELCKLDVRGSSRSATGVYYQGDKPSETCKIHVECVICEESGKLATPYCQHTKRVAVLDLDRESLAGKLKVSDEAAVAIKVPVPDAYKGLLPWAKEADRKLQRELKAKTYVNGYKNCSEFCPLHAKEPEPESESEPETIVIPPREPETTTKKPESETTTKKPESETTTKKPESETSTKKPETEPGTGLTEPESETELNLALIADYEGDWHGVAQFYNCSGAYEDNDFVLAEVIMRLSFDEKGNLTPYLRMDLKGFEDRAGFGSSGESGNFPNLRGELDPSTDSVALTGTFFSGTLDNPTYAVVNANGSLTITTTVTASDGSFDLYMVLRRPDEAWSDEDDPRLTDSGVEYYMGMGLAEIAGEFGLDPSLIPAFSSVGEGAEEGAPTD